MDVGVGGKLSPREWSLANVKSIINKWQTCMYNAGGWNALFLENHDQSRSVSRFTPHRPECRTAAAKMLATLIGLQSGTLFIYQGQELGMHNLPKDWEIDEYKDFETQNLYRLYGFPASFLWDSFQTDAKLTAPRSNMAETPKP
jgi:glycosidase